MNDDIVEVTGMGNMLNKQRIQEERQKDQTEIDDRDGDHNHHRNRGDVSLKDNTDRGNFTGTDEQAKQQGQHVGKAFSFPSQHDDAIADQHDRDSQQYCTDQDQDHQCSYSAVSAEHGCNQRLGHQQGSQQEEAVAHPPSVNQHTDKENPPEDGSQNSRILDHTEGLI